MDVLLTAVLVSLFAIPLIVLFVLVALAHLLPHPSMVARASFACPFSRRKVDVTFETSPGAGYPTDVLACSLFGDGVVRCHKECLALGETTWAPSPVTARWALLAGGESLRELGARPVAPYPARAA